MERSRWRGLSPEARVGIFHFSVFASTGVASVYFAIWLASRGIRPDEVGIISAAPVLVMLAVNLFVGRLADRASDWRQAIIVLALVAGAAPIGLFFVSGFWGILVVWTLCVVPAQSLTPIIDAGTLRMTQRNGTDFGAVRAWGTVGYMTITAVAGPVLQYLGDGAFLPLFLLMSLLRAGLSLQLPRLRHPNREAPMPAVGASRLREVLKPWFVLPLVGFGMHHAIHGVFGAFAALLWAAQGISGGMIGVLIAVSAAAEALMMFVWRRTGWMLSARYMILIAAIVGAVRWSAMAFAPPLWLLFLLQTTHAITYGLAYFGCLHFIANWTSEDIAAEAQGFAFALQQAMSVVALVAIGWSVSAFGDKAWLVAGGFCAAGAALCWMSIRLQPVRAAF